MSARCPADEELRRLALWHSAPGEIAAFAEHLAGCPHCAGRLGALPVFAGQAPETRSERGAEAPPRPAGPVGLAAEQQPETFTLPPTRSAAPGVAGVNGMPAGGIGPSAETLATTPGQASAGGGFPSVSGYEVLGELGRGGMGVVYKALQLGFGRLVALKMIRPDGRAGPDLVARFRTEAQAIARLVHPHIVQVYEVGEWRAGGTHPPLPFFSLEYCPGGSLDRKLLGNPLPPVEAAGLAETLARAVHAAHVAHVIHRDLKPANVLLTADGTPKITDFGLAKKLDEDGHTLPGEVIGTPSYMAPEQAGGKSTLVGPATDVYALGAMLYEFLTGRPPFKAATSLETLQQVVGDEPVPVRRLQPKVPRDLATICHKCLEKDVRRRYADAQALAEDLLRFRTGKPVLARPVGRMARAAKWARRRPAWALLAAVSVLAVAAVVGAGLWHTLEMRRANEDLRRQTRRAELETQKAEQALAAATRNARNTQSFADFLAEVFDGSEVLGLRQYNFYSEDQKRTGLNQVVTRGSRRVRLHLADQPVYQARMLDLLGNAHRSLGQYDEARADLEQALTIRTEQLGGEDLGMADSLFHLGWLDHDLGRYAEAEARYEKALAIRKKHLGPDHRLVADVLFNLGWLRGHQLPEMRPSAERSRKAEECFRECLRIRSAQPEPIDREIGITRLAQAAVLFGRGDRDGEAAALVTMAAGAFGQAEGKPDNVGSALLQFMNAERVRTKGDFAAAEKMHREVLRIARGELGDRHPVTALLLGNLAGLLRSKGDLESAERAIRQALDIGRQSPLRWHPAMADALCQLADYLKERNRGSEAEEFLREALAVAQHRWPAEHARRREIRARLVDLLKKQGRPGDAAKVPE